MYINYKYVYYDLIYHRSRIEIKIFFFIQIPNNFVKMHLTKINTLNVFIVINNDIDIQSKRESSIVKYLTLLFRKTMNIQLIFNKKKKSFAYQSVSLSSKNLKSNSYINISNRDSRSTMRKHFLTFL